MTRPASPLLREFVKLTLLFFMGGMIYFAIEVAVRGYSHWSMMIVGGLAFICVGGINSYFDRNMPLAVQMLFSAVIITTLELIGGLTVNVWLKMDVWDYSNIPFNFMGQICPRFFAVWYFLSAAGILLDDFLRCRMFGEEKQSYTLFKKADMTLKEKKAG